jgi:hypothetical protein
MDYHELQKYELQYTIDQYPYVDLFEGLFDNEEPFNIWKSR